MVAKQLSIFLENKSGRLTEVTEVLAKEGINLSALCIAENADFGNVPGALAKVLQYLSNEGVFIEYMYSFANNNSANVIIRPNDMENCIRVLTEKKVDLLAASDLYKL